MNRQEILAKSRAVRQDEGFQHASNKGLLWGNLILSFIYVAIVIISVLNKQSISAATAMLMGFWAVESFPKYKFTKQPLYLALMIVSSLAAILSIINFARGL